MIRPATSRRIDRGRPARGRPGRLGLAAALVVVLLPACRLVEPVGAPPAAVPVAAGPALAEGVRDPADAMETARLLTEGDQLLAAGRAAEAREVATEIAALYPTAEGSGLSLTLRARASRALGEFADADAALGSFLSLLQPADPLYGPTLIERVDVRSEGGLGGAVELLFQLPPGQLPEVLASAEELAGEFASTMDTGMLRDLVAEAPRHPSLLPVFLTELGVRRYLAGAQEEGSDFAQQALGLSPSPAVAERARSVVEGRVVAGLAITAVIGAVLPRTGPPSVQQLAGEIRDGMEVALRVEERTAPGLVQLLTVDDPGTQEGLRAALDELERGGALGVVGPLEEPGLDAMARAGAGLAILSPTSRMVPEGVGGAFSLAGVDPEAGRALASLVLADGVRDVVVIHPSTREMTEEARWFGEAYRAAGGNISRTITYPAGTTSFASPMGEILRLRPRGLVLLLSQGDVEALAPQLAFYGVDEIEGMTRYGNESWTSPAVVQGLQPRHTQGVRAVTSWLGDDEFGPGWNDFVAAYEDHFQRTLRSPVPALGYDSTRLLLTAARMGGGSRAGTLRAFQEIRDFPGATGVLSVVDGRVRRSYQAVRIQNRNILPISP